jgi:hypothetical protein
LVGYQLEIQPIEYVTSLCNVEDSTIMLELIPGTLRK